MQGQLDKMLKELGHQNAYFPLFIPKSYLSRESNHVEGFAKECAVVTHYKLKSNESKNGVIVDPDSKLEEELIIRPTSETIIWNTYRKWIQSYRDLPILINQWANVVRWEMRTRLFLRTAEFLWQEGHTAHATKGEAIEETVKIINLYTDFVEDYMALPVIKGLKTPSERFGGAEETYSIEALMQDGKALQTGTSHFLGQNFAKAFDVKFSDKDGRQNYVWATSWGVSTRLIGGLIMAHSDDNGLVLPPKLAPIQVVIVPIFKNDVELNAISNKIVPIINSLKACNISVKFDNSDKQSPGWKFNEYELKGVPVRITVGNRDIQNGTCELFRRDEMSKKSIPFEIVVDTILNLLKDIQDNIHEKARKYRDNHTTLADNFEEFKEILNNKKGFVSAHWDGTAETENEIKSLTKATIRCIPLENEKEEGQCIFTKKKSTQRVLFARAY
ncbi:proline--tRNA ligase [Elysia marginata]|uniref:proline--tRNA ligase n=1 Tax=Elysia marginata TaxID=1093978 RepID=A0AAV4H1Z9_9GAST|nr:proline--tRNA ligase [Elysia marginata]